MTSSSESSASSGCEFGNEEMEEEGLPLLEEGDTKYTFCYQHARSIPQFLTEYSENLIILDVSHNQFSDLFELVHFRNLKHLVLDNNLLNDDTKFPPLPQLETLQMNHNSVTRLAPFIRSVSKSYPKLKCLSMLGNPMCPGGSALTGLLKEGEEKDHQLYRCYIASRIKTLNFLDWKPVTSDERVKGFSMYKWSDFVPGVTGKPQNIFSNDSDEDTLVRVEENDDENKTSVASRQKNKYVGNRSEGNRFITNHDL